MNKNFFCFEVFPEFSCNQACEFEVNQKSESDTSPVPTFISSCSTGLFDSCHFRAWLEKRNEGDVLHTSKFRITQGYVCKFALVHDILSEFLYVEIDVASLFHA